MLETVGLIVTPPHSRLEWTARLCPLYSCTVIFAVTTGRVPCSPEGPHPVWSVVCKWRHKGGFWGSWLRGTDSAASSLTFSLPPTGTQMLEMQLSKLPRDEEKELRKLGACPELRGNPLEGWQHRLSLGVRLFHQTMFLPNKVSNSSYADIGNDLKCAQKQEDGYLHWMTEAGTVQTSSGWAKSQKRELQRKALVLQSHCPELACGPGALQEIQFNKIPLSPASENPAIGE
ncbi:hypothetical protein H8959_004941 [Pygathrix nigripes]